MDRPTTIPLRIGEWRLDPQLGQLTRGAEIQRLESRTMRLLLYLANRAGETVSIDELLDNVWSGVVVTQDSVYQVITSLRRLLGDDAKQPKYIITVPRLGYRLVARVAPWEEPLAVEPPKPGTDAVDSVQLPSKRGVFIILATVILIAIAGLVFWRAGAPAARSVAVLPFLDLTTQEMNEEYFADGMTEELIHSLSKLPGFEVPAPTASFFYKGKQLPPATIARELRVAYLLDGSLRESGDTVRVSARLIRGRDGYVMWSESYDRPKADRLMIQDDIAAEVAQAIGTAVR
jgi:TolB-like protein/DNA-binding winged helix-turn-helix (wHTH) protein